MANGKTIELKKAELNKLQKEYDNTRVKNDLVALYGLPVNTIKCVLKNNRCSEKVYNKLFNS
jgi:hypothetical protein